MHSILRAWGLCWRQWFQSDIRRWNMHNSRRLRLCIDLTKIRLSLLRTPKCHHISGPRHDSNPWAFALLGSLAENAHTSDAQCKQDCTTSCCNNNGFSCILSTEDGLSRWRCWGRRWTRCALKYYTAQIKRLSRGTTNRHSIERLIYIPTHCGRSFHRSQKHNPDRYNAEPRLIS